MPYIKTERRRELNPAISALADTLIDMGSEPGDVNYAITQLIRSHIGTTPRYANYNEALGILEAVKQELCRTDMARYEDAAKVMNGPLGVPIAIRHVEP